MSPDRNDTSKDLLSLCMIVRDEADSLPDCVRSVSDIVDDIVVVDTGSADATVKTAESLGAAVYRFEWIDDFSAARNFSIEKASGDWILILDADERLTPENAGKIREIVDTGGGIAYYLNFRSAVRDSAAGSVLVHSHPRLFRNGRGIRYTGRIHEQIVESVTAAGGRIRETDIYVEHSGYRDETMDERGKHERNIRILKKELEENPESGMTLFFLGESYSLLHDWPKAVEYYEAAALRPDLPPLNRALLHQNLGTAYLNAGDSAKALENERRSIEIEPERITPHVVIAEVAEREGNTDLAIWEWQIVLDMADRLQDGSFTRLADFLPETASIRLKLAEAYTVSKDYRSAENLCREILESDPGADSVRLHLAQIQTARGFLKDARTTAMTVLERLPELPAALLLMGKIEGNLGDLDTSLKYFRQVLELDPDNAEAVSDLRKLEKLRRETTGKPEADGAARSAAKAPGEKKREIEAMLRSGETAGALQELSVLCSQYPDDYEVHFLTAYAEDMKGEHASAVKHCLKAAELEDRDPRIHYLLGNVHYKSRQFGPAADAFREAVRREPGMFEAWSGLGVVSVMTKEYEKAKEAFEQAHKLKPDDIQIKKNLAVVCSKLGLQREAERYLLMTKM